MAASPKEMLAKMKKKEAEARAEKRRVMKQIMELYAKTFLKYFPELEDVDDVDAFATHLRELYDAEKHCESSHVTAPQVQPEPYEPVTRDDGFPFPND